MRTRIKYSQNFLKNAGLVRDILSKSSICNEDAVLEIGAGEGIITQELIGRSKNVIAYEIDENLYRRLGERFQSFGNKLKIIPENFLDGELPNFPYKVFSNIPFNITADVIKKLVFDNNPPQDVYLIAQKEAAAKFLGKPLSDKNSLMSIIIGNFYEGSVFHTFKRGDFFPTPSVDTVMLRLRLLEKPLSQPTSLFNDFVSFGYSQFEPNILKGLGKVISENFIVQAAKEESFSVGSKPSQLSQNHWSALFAKFLVSGNKQKVAGNYKRLLSQQSKLQKVHRTREDTNWKQFAK